MTSKKWLVLFFFSSLLFLGFPASLVMGFNYYVDPLWNFDHENRYNQLQDGFNERQQKTNDVTQGKFSYESLLIGTSRTTYLNQFHFKDSVYNYGLSGQSILEYADYIEYAKKQNNKPFNKIYMEMSMTSFSNGHKIPLEPPEVYISNSNDPFYRFTSLFSYDTFKRALENKELSVSNNFTGHRAYLRNNVAITGRDGSSVEEELQEYEQRMKESDLAYYTPNKKYPETIEKLKSNNPNTKWIPFTDPIPVRKLVAMLSVEGYREGYELWYKEMVNHFDEIYSFQGFTPITEGIKQYWIDDSHFTPEAGDMMIKAMENPSKYQDIVTLVSKENVEEYLDNVFKQVDFYKSK